MDADTLLAAALEIAIQAQGDPDKTSDGVHWLAEKLHAFEGRKPNASQDTAAEQ